MTSTVSGSEHENEAQSHARASFSGIPAELLPFEPDLDETMRIVVEARVTAHEDKSLVSGGRRRTVKFVVSRLLKVGGEAPIVGDDPGDEPLPGFDMDPDADDDSDGF